MNTRGILTPNVFVPFIRWREQNKRVTRKTLNINYVIITVKKASALKIQPQQQQIYRLVNQFSGYTKCLFIFIRIILE